MWFKWKINPLTFTVSNHLQMEAPPLSPWFSVLLWSWGREGGTSSLSEESLLFVQLRFEGLRSQSD